MYESDLCICCMSTDNLIDLCVNNDEDAENKNIVESCLSIELSVVNALDDIFICEKCISKIKEYIDFKGKALKNIALLNSVDVTELITEKEFNALYKNKKKIPKINIIDDITLQFGKENNDETSKINLNLTDDNQKDSQLPYNIEKTELKCRECGQEFYSNMRLKVHYNSHFGNHMCGQCNKSYMSRSSLSKHKYTHIKGSFDCKDCGQKFKNINSLYNHRRNKHSNVLPYRCKECGERFATHAQRVTHSSGVHYQHEKRHKCRHCDAMFLHSSHLSKHVLRSHDDTLHTCQLCGFTTRKELLNQHMNRMHKKTNIIRKKEKRFVCKLCSRGFTQKISLKYHISTHTRNGEYAGEPTDLITVKQRENDNDKGLLEGTKSPKYASSAEETSTSSDVDLTIDNIEDFLLDEDELYKIAEGNLDVIDETNVTNKL